MQSTAGPILNILISKTMLSGQYSSPINRLEDIMLKQMDARRESSIWSCLQELAWRSEGILLDW